MQWSRSQVTQWREVQCLKQNSTMSRHQHHQEVMEHWKPPGTGALQINVDASVFTGRLSYSIGIILRDHTGVLQSSKFKEKWGGLSF